MKNTPRELQCTDYNPAIAATAGPRELAVCLVLLAVAFCGCAYPQEKIPSAEIVKVTCTADTTQSYTVYLPSAYTPAKRWPLIYLFDPGGRGKRPVELYKDIAEKYGLILAGSNNSRNFSSDQSKSVNAVWLDTHQRFALDDRRLYTSGFSGGARVAGAMALGCPQCKIAGVIAHGAGYPSNRKKENERVAYYLAVGDQDFNWPEVMQIRREREEQNLPYRVQVFPGTHQWAPPAVMEDAVEWMMLRAMQQGTVARDDAFIDRLYRQREKDAEDAETRKDVLAQLAAYRALASDFAGVKEVTDAEKKLAQFKSSPALKAAWKAEQEQVAEQSRLEDDVSMKIRSYIDGAASDPLVLHNEIVQAMAGLKDQAEHSKNESERLLFRRVLDDLFVAWIETGQQELASHHFEKAEVCFQLISDFRDEAWPVLLLAGAHAAQGRKKAAIKDLREATRRGWNDPEVIASDERLSLIKDDPEVQNLIQQMKKK